MPVLECSSFPQCVLLDLPDTILLLLLNPASMTSALSSHSKTIITAALGILAYAAVKGREEPIMHIISNNWHDRINVLEKIAQALDKEVETRITQGPLDVNSH